MWNNFWVGLGVLAVLAILVSLVFTWLIEGTNKFLEKRGLLNIENNKEDKE